MQREEHSSHCTPKQTPSYRRPSLFRGRGPEIDPIEGLHRAPASCTYLLPRSMRTSPAPLSATFCFVPRGAGRPGATAPARLGRQAAPRPAARRAAPAAEINEQPALQVAPRNSTLSLKGILGSLSNDIPPLSGSKPRRFLEPFWEMLPSASPSSPSHTS